MKNYFLLKVFAFTILLSSCNPTDLTPADELNTINPSKIYIAGIYEGDACYWKDGVITMLKNVPGKSITSHASSIFVSGNDVYCAGRVINNSIGYPVYWKNGVENILSNTSGSVSSITVSGNDVYVLGNQNQVPCYWKNGVLTLFNATSNSFANDLKVEGNDVYIAGSVTQSGQTSSRSAAYWKNGVLNILPKISNNSCEATKLVVNNNDVYVCGGEFGNQNQGICWKNGNTEYRLGNGTKATGIEVFGKDVFISGSRFDTYLNNDKSKYWKNGVEYNVSNNTNETIATSIAIKSNNVFLTEFMTGAGCGLEGNMNTIINGINVNVIVNAYPSAIFVVE